MRTFIAIDLSEGIRNYLGRVSQELNKYLSKGDVRWVTPEKIHLTLCFLGETENDKLSDICDIMDESTRQVEPFELMLGALGCFPNAKRPRVIWVGFQASIEDLTSLQRGLEEKIVKLGWKAESRTYHPHLTLGRVKNSPAVVRAQLPWEQEMSKRRVGVSAIMLYESRLKPSGPEYVLLHTSRLSTNN
ncbi:MAG: RNA 2',3'-cyclic phosphodiesterase [Anaerolineae bacterium]|nr:MAG: RNA 2',3'-cyclic phosphodiesterase [Anaerolineae bacterium]